MSEAGAGAGWAPTRERPTFGGWLGTRVPKGWRVRVRDFVWPWIVPVNFTASPSNTSVAVPTTAGFVSAATNGRSYGVPVVV